MLAVNVNYEKRQATIGTEKGKSVPMTEIFSELESIGYKGEIVKPDE